MKTNDADAELCLSNSIQYIQLIMIYIYIIYYTFALWQRKLGLASIRL